MAKSRAERDRSSLQRRLEVLKLPVVALQRHGYLKPTDRAEWQAEPEAIGVGPYGAAFAPWPHCNDARRKQVTSHVDETADTDSSADGIASRQLKASVDQGELTERMRST